MVYLGSWAVIVLVVLPASVGLVVRFDGSNPSEGVALVDHPTETSIRPSREEWIRRRLKHLQNLRSQRLETGWVGNAVDYAIDVFNSDAYENLKAQFSEEGRGRVVIMSYATPSPSCIDGEHINAAATWIRLGIDVLFYRQQVGEYDVGDVMKRVSDLAFEKMVEADVLLEDHRTYMDDMFRLEHFMEVISDVYKKNKEIRSAEFSKSSSAGPLVKLAILTCSGAETLTELKNMGGRARRKAYKPIYDSLNDLAAGPNRTLVLPTGPQLKVGNFKAPQGTKSVLRPEYIGQHLGNGIYQRGLYRLCDIEAKVNVFFNVKVFSEEECHKMKV